MSSIARSLLLPPLLLARIIDGLTGGMPLAFTAALAAVLFAAVWRMMRDKEV